MNAGAFGGETWDYITAVDFINMAGEVRHCQKSEFSYSYRYLQLLEPGFFIAAYFAFEKHEEHSSSSIKQLLHKRSLSQPIGSFNCGSVFKNPPGDYAARLIEQCGLKNMAIGDAIVSEKHANFIINNGNASSSDIISLINYIKTKVFEKFAIELELEVKILD